MPETNYFKHQAYHPEPPAAPHHLLSAISPIDPSSPEFSEQLAVAGKRFGDANVAAIYCVHGTFVGNDVLGLLTELARFAPAISKQLSRVGKRAIDLITGEAGNYTRAMTSTLEANLAKGAARTIPIQQFQWSSQNHHIARVDGAIRLIDDLAQFATTPEATELARRSQSRIQFWAHSHGGNVLALVTQLLGANQEVRDEFFQATKSFYEPWIRSRSDMPVWQRVRDLLNADDHPVRHLLLDMVTFGTPIRYGWSTNGYANLLHFIHHRPPLQGASHQTPIPLKLLRALRASDGDYIQQIGIAGTNFPPLPFAVRTLLADLRLSKFLEHNLASEGIISRLRQRTRVADEGTTLLVDYTKISPWPNRHIAGHGLYTRQKWLPFHCQKIAEHFYPE